MKQTGHIKNMMMIRASIIWVILMMMMLAFNAMMTMMLAMNTLMQARYYGIWLSLEEERNGKFSLEDGNGKFLLEDGNGKCGRKIPDWFDSR